MFQLLPIGLPHFLLLSVLLFCLGFYTVVSRTNTIAILMGVELILNAANINFIAFAHFSELTDTLAGQLIPIFVIMLAAAEIAIGLAIVLAIFKIWGSIDTQITTSLKD